jgi:hypothetical protein
MRSLVILLCRGRGVWGAIVNRWHGSRASQAWLVTYRSLTYTRETALETVKAGAVFFDSSEKSVGEFGLGQLGK